MVPEADDHPRVALLAVNYHSICGLLWYDTASHGQTRHLRSSLSDLALPRQERGAGVRPWCADNLKRRRNALWTQPVNPSPSW